MKDFIKQKFGGEFLFVNIDHSPDLESVESCGDYLGILLNGNSIPQVNEKSKWIKENSNLLVGWETDYFDSLPKDLDLSLINFIRIGKKFYEVQLSREVDENYNPVYGLVEL